ncbi:MAG TPA: class I SAM-dependent methyltransferase, partial [Kofleriaceae bacterium]|nr:class I SAM-dependent methyltransferase [Kofleriaceae bacterium]
MQATTNGRLWGMRARVWATLQEQQCRALYEAVLDATAAPAGTRYLDVGCGTGFAVSLGHARGYTVSGVDAASASIAVAKERTSSADLRVGELERLPFGDASFELVTGFNSFQYAANPVEALREAARVTVPGGTIVMAAWAKPESSDAGRIVGALKQFMPAPPPGTPGPFALSEDGALRALVADAGLEPGASAEVDCHWIYPDLQSGVAGLGSSGVAVR